MKRRALLDQIQDTLTTTEWISKISAWPESMSTSPSGFHLTHSKTRVAKTRPFPRVSRLHSTRRTTGATYPMAGGPSQCRHQKPIFLPPVAINRQHHDLKTTMQPQNTPPLRYSLIRT